MTSTIYVLKCFHRGRKQSEERFSSERRARLRAAHLGSVCDIVTLGEKSTHAEPVNDSAGTRLGAPDLQE